jgi:hypothetical protein
VQQGRFDPYRVRQRDHAAAIIGRQGAVEAAEILHSRDNELVDLGLMSDGPADTDFDIFEEKREQNRRAKEDMLSAARVTLVSRN